MLSGRARCGDLPSALTPGPCTIEAFAQANGEVTVTVKRTNITFIQVQKCSPLWLRIVSKLDNPAKPGTTVTRLV